MLQISYVCLVAQLCLTVTPWTMPARLLCPWGFSRQEYWSELPFPSPGDLPNPGIKLASPAWQADSLPLAPPGKPQNRDGHTVRNTQGATVWKLTIVMILITLR